MSESANNLYALAFDDEYKADEARALFKRMAGEGLLVLDQTAVVVVGIDGKAHTTQDVDVTGTRRTQGHWVGIVAAAITGTLPLIMAGTVAGQVVGRLTDQGITKQLMKLIADSLTPGTSALFVLGRATDDESREQLVKRLRPFQPKIVEASVSPELRSTIEKLLEEPPAAPTS